MARHRDTEQHRPGVEYELRVRIRELEAQALTTEKRATKAERERDVWRSVARAQRRLVDLLDTDKDVT